MTREDIDRIELMSKSEAWQVYVREMKYIFDNSYKKLRKFKKSDSLYERTNGFLDGIEKALNLIEEIVQENKADNSEQEPAKGDVL